MFSFPFPHVFPWRDKFSIYTDLLFLFVHVDKFSHIFQQFLKHYLKINVAKVVSNVCIGIYYDADTVVCIVWFIDYKS